MSIKGNLSNEFNLLEFLEYILNIINHVCIGFITIYMSWICLRDDLAGTRLHAWLCTIGFNFLMAEAIMCHYSGNIIIFSDKRATRTTIHWILQVLGGSIGLAGSLIKLIEDDFFMYSTHGKLGLSASVLCLFSLISGLIALFSIKIRLILNPLFNKTFHNLIGLATFVIALTAQFYGYEIGFFCRETSVDFQLLMKCITLIVLILSSIGSLKAVYHKMKNIGSNLNTQLSLT